VAATALFIATNAGNHNTDSLAAATAFIASATWDCNKAGNLAAYWKDGR
jgi:hypothetical protein